MSAEFLPDAASTTAHLGAGAPLWRPKVAAVMCTIVGPRHAYARSTVAAEIVACVQSMLANDYAPLEVLVVDQSATDVVAHALRPLQQADARLRYLHSEQAGKSRALNLAVNASDADLFVFTDDDCLVASDWVSQAVEVFRRHPDAGVVFGDVRPPAGLDWRTNFVPMLPISAEQRLQNRFLPRSNNLLGANMAVRRATFERIGLFDEALGPGARIQANEEVDLQLRALRARPMIDVYLTPEMHVIHEHGQRPQGEPTQRLLRTYHSGRAAMLLKHAGHGDLGAACRLGLLALEPFADAVTHLVRSGRPRGLGMLAPFARGIRGGLALATPRYQAPRLVH